MRPFVLVSCFLLAAACGDDGMPPDGALPDAPGMDARPRPDAPGCGGGEPCAECEECVDGRCRDLPRGAACPDGLCFAGACCTGCLLAMACSEGNFATACGTGGEDCVGCDPCDECPSGACLPRNAVVSIDVSDHGCMAGAAGTLDCWGNNGAGQLGTGDLEPQSGPTPVFITEPVVEVAVGAEHSCAITEEGALFCWGLDARGQLGTGFPGGSEIVPTPITEPRLPWASLSAGKDHGCAIAQDRTLWCWGWNESGQVGVPDAVPLAGSPTRVQPGAWRVVSAGRNHTCAVTEDDRLFCWGDNTDGQLGLGTTGGIVALPAEVAPPAGESGYETVSAGDRHSCAITSSGALVCFGAGEGGLLGTGDETARSSPARVGSDLFTAVAAGPISSCAVRSDGTLHCWGRNTGGLLGTGDPDPATIALSPMQVGDETDHERVVVGSAACGLSAIGAASCWGPGLVNGLGGRGPSPTPRRLCPI